MFICGFQKLTLLDYPGKTACTVFTGGCDFRCPFCHNALLVTEIDKNSTVSEEYIFNFLKKRHGLLDGVCITGGEPTLQPDLDVFIRKIRELGFSVKLDTNGNHPEVLERLLAEGLLDFVAMDIKSSPENYARVAGVPDLNMENIQKSVSLLMGGNLPYEFRTTVVKGLHTVRDFEEIGKWLKGAARYFLQEFKDSGELIAPSGLGAFSKEEMENFLASVIPYIPSASIRGID